MNQLDNLTNAEKKHEIVMYRNGQDLYNALITRLVEMKPEGKHQILIMVQHEKHRDAQVLPKVLATQLPEKRQTGV